MKKVILMIMAVGMSGLIYASSPDHGTKTIKNGITILNLTGTDQEMGVQYGQFEQQELQFYYQGLLSNPQIINFNDPTTEQYVQLIYSELPESFQQILQGIAIGSNMSLLQIQQMVAAEPLSLAFGCSVLMTSESVNANKHNAIVRNFDTLNIVNSLQLPNSRVIITILNNKKVLIGSLINIPAATVINKDGVFVEENNGLSSDPTINPQQPFNTITLNDKAFHKNTNVDEIIYGLLTELPSSAYMVGIVSESNAPTYLEIAPTKSLIGTNTPNNNIIVYTNVFNDNVVNNQIYYTESHDTPSQAVRRFAQLESLAINQYKTNTLFTENDLKNIITTTIASGGAFETVGEISLTNPDTTVFSVYYDPVDKLLSIYPQDTKVWTDINLNNYLKP